MSQPNMTGVCGSEAEQARLECHKAVMKMLAANPELTTEQVYDYADTAVAALEARPDLLVRLYGVAVAKRTNPPAETATVPVRRLAPGDEFLWCGRRVTVRVVEPGVKKYLTPHQRLSRRLAVVEEHGWEHSLHYYDDEFVEVPVPARDEA